MITIEPVMEMLSVRPKIVSYLEPREVEYTKGYIEEASRIAMNADWQDPKQFYEYNCKSNVGVTGSLCEWIAIYLVRKHGFMKEGTTIRYCSAHPDAMKHEYSGQDFLLNHPGWRATYGANCKSAHIDENELRISQYHPEPLAKYNKFKVHRFLFVDRVNMKMVVILNENFSELFANGDFTQRDDGYWVCPLDKVLAFPNSQLISDNE